MLCKIYSLCLLQQILLQGWFSNFMVTSESCGMHLKAQIAIHQFLIQLVWAWAQEFSFLTSFYMLFIFPDMYTRMSSHFEKHNVSIIPKIIWKILHMILNVRPNCPLPLLYKLYVFYYFCCYCLLRLATIHRSL